MTYANGNTVSYTYDPFDRTTAETYNDGTTNHYIYASDGSLARQYIRPNIGRNGKLQPGRVYDFGGGRYIRDDIAGHTFKGGVSMGRHFNTPTGMHCFY